ncbi:hypothetical protein PR003_g28826 [Phytophthora rubi]|uniref:Uncharacterized protein n=1 Tax=Phytophthora rubi TaxID=129364 RepID=A0A6A4BWR7_9STRA|nr:hypothetical protein PR001_g27659 [Phytophthora rubi]KAE8974110.1 hypothetical protein PR002_g26007 [Phytophthora rubi]KAE9277308.1 hypothetical protein PR003_g28826 [Phytophthora rubi]
MRLIAAPAHQRAEKKSTKAHSRWSALSAAGWMASSGTASDGSSASTHGGEQLLLRVKHHALSTYNPVPAGLHCPHADCQRIGWADLQMCSCHALRRRALGQSWLRAGGQRGSMVSMLKPLFAPSSSRLCPPA